MFEGVHQDPLTHESWSPTCEVLCLQSRTGLILLYKRQGLYLQRRRGQSKTGWKTCGCRNARETSPGTCRNFEELRHCPAQPSSLRDW